MERISRWLFLSLMLINLITGCGGNGNKITSDIKSSPNNVAGSASLRISANFPANNSTGEVGKSKIDPKTQYIYVYLYQYGLGIDKYATLTPNSPTATIDGLLPGKFYINIFTTDANGDELDYLYGSGTLADGENNFTAILLRANWEFVDSNGAKTTIALNKTLSSSPETIWGFSIAPYEFYNYQNAKIKKNAIDKEKPWEFAAYPFIWRGSNFNTNVGADSSEYHSGYIYYVNQFIGPNTSNNALDMGHDIEFEFNGLPLTPTSNYTGIEMTNRYAFVFGLPVTFDIFGEEYNMPPGTFTQNGVDVSGEIDSFATTKAVNRDTIEGNIVEVLEKAFSVGTIKCYQDSTKTTQITCPNNPYNPISNQMIRKSSMKAIKKYLTKAFKSGIKKSIIDDKGCMSNVVNTWTDEWDSWAPNYGYYYIVIENVSTTFDACRHTFKAKAKDLDLPVANASVNVVKK